MYIKFFVLIQNEKRNPFTIPFYQKKYLIYNMPVFIINPSEFLFIISADRLMDFNKNDKLQPF